MVDEQILEIMVDFANALEAAVVDLKRRIAEIIGAKNEVAVQETTFTTLKFEPQEGARIGSYEVAYKRNNIPEKFTHAYNILRKNNAIISNRYYGNGYIYSYWLFGEDRIFRQKRNVQVEAK